MTACQHPKSAGAKACRACNNAARRLAITRVCAHCGSAFARKSKGRDALRFCSKACAGAERTKSKKPRARVVPSQRQCVACGVTFTTHQKARVCSSECRKAYRLAKYKADCACRVCGVALVYRVGHTRSKFCSATCRRKSMRARETHKEAKRASKAMRRARAKGADGEMVRPFAVFDRDGWHCQICGVATPRDKRGTYEPDAPELDHIIPLAAGGSHTYANTQCACRRCNGAKGDTVGAPSFSRAVSDGDRCRRCCRLGC